VTAFEGKIIGQAVSAEQSHADIHAFISYYNEYFPRVFNYIYYRMGDSVVSDDLTAIVFERALKKFKNFSPHKGSFGAWLFAIARNVVNAHLKSQGQHACLSIDDLHEHPGNTILPEEALIKGEIHNELLIALKQLSERERDLLGLKFTACITNRQIASMTSISESNVGIILYRAIQKLRSQLVPQEGEK